MPAQNHRDADIPHLPGHLAKIYAIQFGHLRSHSIVDLEDLIVCVTISFQARNTCYVAAHTLRCPCEHQRNQREQCQGGRERPHGYDSASNAQQ
jgi:hypothetical protein